MYFGPLKPKVPSTKYPIGAFSESGQSPDGSWIQGGAHLIGNEEKELRNSGSGPFWAELCLNGHGSHSPFPWACCLRHRIPILFHCRIRRIPAYMVEWKRNRVHLEIYIGSEMVENLILVGDGNEVFTGEASVRFVRGLWELAELLLPLWSLF